MSICTRTFAVLAVAAVTAATGAARGADNTRVPAPVGDQEFRLTFGGVERRYGVHVPTGYDGTRRVPLVMMLHGGGGTGKGAAWETGWSIKADQVGFLALFPEALPPNPAKHSSFARNPQAWNDGSGRFAAGQNQVDDVGFLKAVLDDVTAHFAVDSRRIFVTGFSNGASMAFRFAAEASARLAAVAPVAGACWVTPRSLERPLSMLYVTGAADSLNPLAGGVPQFRNGRGGAGLSTAKPPVHDSVLKWVRAVGCPEEPASAAVATGMRTERYGPGRNGAEVVCITVDGLGHVWPGGRSALPAAMVGARSDRVRATDVIWQFFARHALAGGTIPGAGVAWATSGPLTPPARAPALPAGAIRTTAGPITGAESDGVRSYKGIPFAAPPVGDLRWRPPQPPDPWTEPRACVKFGPACPQQGKDLYGPVGDESEDCLYLNVWTPAKAGAARLPVMFWIHGGGFSLGTAGKLAYDGAELARRGGVVVVSCNYRLGPFGFLAHPALTAESPQQTSGNYGLMDQVEALFWVRQNIAAFGGDPECVTIIGQSAGGVSVCALMASPLAEGLFQRAIVQSGSAPGTLYGRAWMEARGVEFEKRLGARGLPALRAASVAALLAAAAKPGGRVGEGTQSSLCIDGYVLPESPRTVFARGHQHNVPLLAGTTRDEDRLFHVGVQALVETMVAVQPQTFCYEFQRVPPNAAAQSLGCFHGAELPYLFGGTSPTLGFRAEDARLSDLMIGYWTRFASSGDPNGPVVPPWRAYDAQTRHVQPLDVSAQKP